MSEGKGLDQISWRTSVTSVFGRLEHRPLNVQLKTNFCLLISQTNNLFLDFMKREGSLTSKRNFVPIIKIKNTAGFLNFCFAPVSRWNHVLKSWFIGQGHRKLFLHSGRNEFTRGRRRDLASSITVWGKEQPGDSQCPATAPLYCSIWDAVEGPQAIPQPQICLASSSLPTTASYINAQDFQATKGVGKGSLKTTFLKDRVICKTHSGGQTLPKHRYEESRVF